MADADQYLYQFRIIIVGESTVGKSCILRRFTEKRFMEHNDPTVGVDFHTRTVFVDGHSLKLQLWDTAGQERFRAITRAYYRNAVGVLLVFNIADHESFAKLPDWIDDVEQASKPHNPVFVLVGNKCDQERDRQVLRREAEKFARSNRMDYIETSARTDTNIVEAFELQAKRIYEAIQEGRIMIGNGWDGVKKGDEPESLRDSRSVSVQQKSKATSRKTQGNKACCSLA